MFRCGTLTWNLSSKILDGDGLMNKNILKAGAAFIGATMTATAAVAASVSPNAAVEILAPLQLSAGTNTLNFGKIIRPATGNANIVVDTDDSTTIDPALTAVGAGQTAGDFDITGTSGENVTITVTAANPSGVDGVTLSNFQIRYNGSGGNSASPMTGQTLTGSDTVDIGATLNVTSAAVTGDRSTDLGYTVDVSYE